jgi:hypothetical protein
VTERIVILLPRGLQIPVVGPEGVHWERLPDGRIRAEYTREELRLCVDIIGACVACSGRRPCVLCKERHRAPRRVDDTEGEDGVGIG